MQPLLDLRNEPTKHSNTNKIKYHLYQSKIPGLLKKYKWYKKARKMFEIVPQGKNDFDPITFIEFAMAINSNFCVIDKMTTISNSADAQILVFKRSMVEKHIQDGDKSQLEYAFRITIGENFNYIRVYVFYNLIQFLYPVEYDNEYIGFIENEHTTFRLNGIFDNYKSDSLLRQTGIYFANTNHKCPKCLRTMFYEFQSKTTQIVKAKIGQTNDFIKALQMFPGSIQISVQNLKLDAYSFMIEHDTLPETISIDQDVLSIIQNDSPVSLHSIVLVFSWAPLIFRMCNFIELDGSFRGVRPYCFCVANSIINNESYPIALSVTPTESELLYDQIVECAEKVGIDKSEWKSKCLLSDMGTSLISFALKFCNFHYFCHSHILEFFGANSGLCFYVGKLLRCYSMEEYDDKRLLISKELKYLIKVRTDLGIQSQKFDDKVKVLRIMLSGNETHFNNMWHFSHWGLWCRYGVSSCSNHNEGFHRKCSSLCSSNSNFLTKFTNITQKVLRHASKIKNNNGKLLKQKCNRRRDQILLKLKESIHSYRYYSNETCKCNKTKYLSNLYGVFFPCKHCALANSLKDITNLNVDDDTVNQIIINILEFDQKTKFKNKNQANFESIKIKFQNINPCLLNNLVVSVLKSIHIQHPKNIDFPLDLDFQRMKINRFVDKHNQKQHKANNIDNNADNNEGNSVIPRVKIPNDSDDQFWYRGIDSDIIRKAMMLKHETICEIEYVYPSLKENHKSVKICDLYFITYFQQKEEKNLDESFIQFKIDCWAEADRIMKQKKLLD